MRRRLREQRRHPEPDLPLAELQRQNWQASNNWRASVSYVAGAQQHEVRLSGRLPDGRSTFPYTNSQFVTYRMQQRRADQLTEIIDCNLIQQRVRYDAFYAQDQWTLGRITLQGALRFDHARASFPSGPSAASASCRPSRSFPETKGVDAYNDLTPRGGVAYDLFGNGKTSLKVNFGRYLEAAQNGGPVHRAAVRRRASRRRRRARGPTRTATSCPTATC